MWNGRCGRTLLTPAEQVAFYAGLMLSDEFHHAFGYTENAILMKPDTTYDEDLCNIKALAYRFGRDNAKAAAGDLLTYTEGRRRAFYKQLQDTRAALAEFQKDKPVDFLKQNEWREMVTALESQFPGGTQDTLMGSGGLGPQQPLGSYYFAAGGTIVSQPCGHRYL